MDLVPERYVQLPTLNAKNLKFITPSYSLERKGRPNLPVSNVM
jgi:hypothetical protein